MEYNPVVLYQRVIEDLCREVPIFEALKSLPEAPPDASPKLAACFSLRDSFLKKLRVENTVDADSRCLLKFLTTNKKCEDWSNTIKSSKVEVLAGIFKDVLYKFFDPEFFPDDLVYYFRQGRSGPGVTFSSKSTDLYSKMYSSALSAKSSLMYDMYIRSLHDQPLGIAAEKTRRDSHGEVIITNANRLSFVPKYTTVSRSICIEPTLSMIYQLGVSSCIEKRLNNLFGIDIRYQPEKNRVLCRKSSRLLPMFTMDLSSASDSISLKMLEVYLPRYILSLLKFGRSEYCDIDTYGLRIPLSMVSTMGNGYTFSLQTALFASAVIACYKFRGINIVYPRNEEYGNFAVFGDDIIAHRSVYSDVSDLLDHLGFEVNVDKSFVDGPFRESCGVDFYSGVNIRGVYVKTYSSPQDCTSIVNELNLFSARTGVYLRGTVQFLCAMLRKAHNLLYVPLDSPSFSGIRVPLSFWSPRLDRNGSYIFRCFEPISIGYEVLDDRVKFRRYVPRNLFSFNPFGFELSFLAGAIKDSFSAVRHDSIRYRVRKRVTPRWDYLPLNQPFEVWLDWRRFGTAVYINLFG